MFRKKKPITNVNLAYRGIRRLGPRLAEKYGRAIEELDLSHNNVSSVGELHEFAALRSLILDNNKMTSHSKFPPLPRLRLLWLNKNKISNLSVLIDKLVECAPHLQTLSLLGNDCCPNYLNGGSVDDYHDYRLYAIARLPELRQLDDSAVSRAERDEANARYAKLATKQSGTERERVKQQRLNAAREHAQRVEEERRARAKEAQRQRRVERRRAREQAKRRRQEADKPPPEPSPKLPRPDALPTPDLTRTIEAQPPSPVLAGNRYAASAPSVAAKSKTTKTVAAATIASSSSSSSVFEDFGQLADALPDLPAPAYSLNVSAPNIDDLDDDDDDDDDDWSTTDESSGAPDSNSSDGWSTSE
jgi:Leucine-rich repeat